jgi:hypothetical protein
MCIDYSYHLSHTHLASSVVYPLWVILFVVESNDYPRDVHADIRLGDGAYWTCCTDMIEPGDDRTVAWYTEFSEKVPKEDVLRNTLQVRIRGHDGKSGDRVIGRALLKNVDLLFLDEGNWVQFIGDILDRDLHVMGRYSITVKYRPLESEPAFPQTPHAHNIAAAPVEKAAVAAAAASEKVKSGVLEVLSIAFTDLVSPGKSHRARACLYNVCDV